MAPIVHTYRSDELGLFVNSYLVEGAEGVVAIDAPLLLSDGRAFRARFDELKKPPARRAGHAPAPRSLHQRRYLLMAREAIARAASCRAQLSGDEANYVTSLTERHLPAAPLSWLVGAGASAVVGELAQDGAPA